MSEKDQEEIKEKLIQKIEGLPTLPDVLANLNEIMMDPNASAKEAAEVIQRDPAITSKILRVVNSSFYGFSKKIKTITHAIVILGFNTVKSIVLSASMVEMFDSESSSEHFDHSDFWKHSIGVGSAAKILAQWNGADNPEEYFTAGLLHDLGKVVLDGYMEDDFLEVMDTVNEKDCLFKDAEEEVLGMNHTDIGGLLFEDWNLSDNLIEAAKFHHEPSKCIDHPEVVSSVHLGDIICRSMLAGSGGDRRIPKLSDFAWETLDIDMDDLGGIYEDTDEELEKAEVYLSLIE